MDKILVGLDASPRAPAVLAAAVALARAWNAKLVLFRAVGIPLEIPKEAFNIAPDKTEELLERLARTELEQLAKAVPAEVIGEVRVHPGTPWRAICAAAKDFGADLIVIGSHGYDALDHVLGTTAAKVVNHAGCSVLVVRKPLSA